MNDIHPAVKVVILLMLTGAVYAMGKMDERDAAAERAYHCMMHEIWLEDKAAGVPVWDRKGYPTSGGYDCDK